MKLLLLIALFSVTMLQAQVKIVFEDEVSDGFILGINGFLQNESKQQTIVITDFDTSTYDISIRQGANEINKKIQLREKGIHKYVVTTDFHGKLRLRYRGLQSKLPSNAHLATISKDLKWPMISSPEVIAAASNINESESIDSVVVASQARLVETDTTSSIEDTAQTKIQAVAATPIISNSSTVKDSLSSVDTAITGNATDDLGRSDSSATSVQSATTALFPSFYKELTVQEFEFERLSVCENYLTNNQITAGQLGKMLEQLKYDQSKMQLTKSAYDRVIDPENLAELSKLFEYEISKSQFILFLNE